MTQINPRTVIERGIITNVSEEQIQQVGIDLTISEAVVVEPGQFVNLAVEQQFNMKGCFGLIATRSSLSRMGVFLTSGVYDPGFVGTGGVSIYNLGKTAVMFAKGFRVGQIVCFEADAASEYNGHYNNTDSVKSQYEAPNGQIKN